jgi:hypothetical protein
MSDTKIIELDFNDKLQVTINNTKPVVLTDLTLALLGIGQQYESFIENETSDPSGSGSELFIKEVRSGSIIVELVAQTLTVAPLLWQGGSLTEWANHAKSILEWLNGKLPQPPKDVSKQDLKQWNNILEPIAKDNGSQLNFSVSSGGQVINHFFINSDQANSAQNAIRREIGAIDEPSDHIQKQRVMVWHQAKFDDESQTGNKAVIESISKSPVKVIFENNIVKKALMAGDSKFQKPWHKLAYIVEALLHKSLCLPACSR